MWEGNEVLSVGEWRDLAIEKGEHGGPPSLTDAPQLFMENLLLKHNGYRNPT